MAYEDNFKEFLKNSGCEEEKLSSKEIMELQTAINNSKDSASFEEEHREFNRQAEEMRKLYISDNANNPSTPSDKTEKEKAFTPKQWSKPQKSLIDISEIEKDLFVKHKDYEITFQDMLESSKDSLDIIYHKPTFGLPIPTNPRYQKYSLQERTKLLNDYYTKINKLQTKLAKKSLHRAAYSKPILPSNKFKNSLNKGESKDEEATEDFLDQIQPQDFYISRSGRQVKRKIYTEDIEIDSDSDFTTSTKKNKADNSDTKITMDTPYIPEESQEEKSPPKLTKTRKEAQRRLSYSNTKKMSRSDVMFENLINEEPRRKQQEEVMKNFEKTLPSFTELDDDKLIMDDSPVKEVSEENDENLMRKRVVPPIPGRKGSRAKKQIKQQDYDKIDVEVEFPQNSPSRKYTNLKSANKANKSQSSKETPKEKPPSVNVEKRDCPICGKQFPQSEIENHASNCGIDENGDFLENTVPEKQADRITCELCDRVFLVSTNFEVHVKKCVAEKTTNL